LAKFEDFKMTISNWFQ